MIYYERYERRRFLLSMSPKAGSIWRPKHSPVDKIIVKCIFHNEEYTNSTVLCSHLYQMYDFTIRIDKFNYYFIPLEV